MKRGVLATLMIAAALPRAAWAGCHGGGGHGGGHSHPTCHEVSDVVGRQRCGHFGRWDGASTPNLEVTAAFAYTGLAVPATAVPEGKAAALGLDMRFLARGRPLFFGAELLVAGVDTPFAAAALPYQSTTQAPSLLGAGVVVGAALPVGPLDLEAELLAGGRFFNVGHPVPGCDRKDSAFGGGAMVQPRVGLQIWLAPQVTLAATGGVGLTDRLAPLFIVGAGWHARRFDGR